MLYIINVPTRTQFFFSLGRLHSLRCMIIQFSHDLDLPLSRNQGIYLETQHQQNTHQKQIYLDQDS